MSEQLIKPENHLLALIKNLAKDDTEPSWRCELFQGLVDMIERLEQENRKMRDVLMSFDGGGDGLDCVEDDGGSPNYRDVFHEYVDLARTTLRAIASRELVKEK